MKKVIILRNKEARKKIMRTCKFSSQALSQALSFDRNSPKCQMARKMAMENGGILIEERIPAIEWAKQQKK